MEQLKDFKDSNLPNYVCLTHKSIYGLKVVTGSLETWIHCLTTVDASLFTYHHNNVCFCAYICR